MYLGIDLTSQLCTKLLGQNFSHFLVHGFNVFVGECAIASPVEQPERQTALSIRHIGAPVLIE
jgi:hypothetical protein